MSNPAFQLPADGWYNIEAKGEHPNRAAGVVQVIDDQAIQSIVNRFNADAAAGKLSHGNEMLIDHEHFKHDADKETTAYGWLSQLQGRADGIYGKIRWTATGQPAVQGGDYRFFSTEYNPSDLTVLNTESPKRARPTRLDGLTLTNQPNNKGQKPITNRATDTPSPAPAKVDPIISTPALDAWFKCLATIKNAHQEHLNGPIHYQAMWNLGRQQFPKEYEAVFGCADDLPQPDSASNARMAQQAVATIANRISGSSGLSAMHSFHFVRDNFPALYRRQTPGILNGQRQKPRPKAVQETAAHIFNRKVSGHQCATNCSMATAIGMANREEPILGEFVAGRLTALDLMTHHPELWEKLEAQTA